MQTLITRKPRKIRFPQNPPNRVREIRNSRGFSAQDIATALGVTQPTITELETERSSAIGPDKWLLLSDLLDTDLRILRRPPSILSPES